MIPASSIRIAHDIYPPECLETAIEDFRAYCSIEKTSQNLSDSYIKLEALPEFGHEASRICDEFLNYLLDLSLQFQLANS
jgi:hypothetical protein